MGLPFRVRTQAQDVTSRPPGYDRILNGALEGLVIEADDINKASLKVHSRDHLRYL